MAHPRAGADRHGALHHEHGAAPSSAVELVDHRPDGGEVGVAGIGGRRADGDVEEVGSVDRLGDVEREREPLGVPREQLLEPRLEDRHLAGAQLLDPFGQHVAHDDLVAEIGEARARHQPDVTRAEDADLAHANEPTYLIEESGLRPFAIASMVSFESESRSVLTTQ